jgi:hypothetical protein
MEEKQMTVTLDAFEQEIEDTAEQFVPITGAKRQEIEAILSTQYESLMEGLNELLEYAKGDKTKGRSKVVYTEAPPDVEKALREGEIVYDVLPPLTPEDMAQKEAIMAEPNTAFKNNLT